MMKRTLQSLFFLGLLSCGASEEQAVAPSTDSSLQSLKVRQRSIRNNEEIQSVIRFAIDGPWSEEELATITTEGKALPTTGEFDAVLVLLSCANDTPDVVNQAFTLKALEEAGVIVPFDPTQPQASGTCSVVNRLEGLPSTDEANYVPFVDGGRYSYFKDPADTKNKTPVIESVLKTITYGTFVLSQVDVLKKNLQETRSFFVYDEGETQPSLLNGLKDEVNRPGEIIALVSSLIRPNVSLWGLPLSLLAIKGLIQEILAATQAPVASLMAQFQDDFKGWIDASWDQVFKKLRDEHPAILSQYMDCLAIKRDFLAASLVIMPYFVKYSLEQEAESKVRYRYHGIARLLRHMLRYEDPDLRSVLAVSRFARRY